MSQRRNLSRIFSSLRQTAAPDHFARRDFIWSAWHLIKRKTRARTPPGPLFVSESLIEFRCDPN